MTLSRLEVEVKRCIIAVSQRVVQSIPSPRHPEASPSIPKLLGLPANGAHLQSKSETGFRMAALTKEFFPFLNSIGVMDGKGTLGSPNLCPRPRTLNPSYTRQFPLQMRDRHGYEATFGVRAVLSALVLTEVCFSGHGIMMQRSCSGRDPVFG